MRGRPFRKGYDRRRHILTTEERRRGGLTTWHRIMAEVRLSMNLPLPSEEVRAAARQLLMERRNRKSVFAGLEVDLPF